MMTGAFSGTKLHSPTDATPPSGATLIFTADLESRVVQDLGLLPVTMSEADLEDKVAFTDGPYAFEVTAPA